MYILDSHNGPEYSVLAVLDRHLRVLPVHFRQFRVSDSRISSRLGFRADSEFSLTTPDMCPF